MNTTNLITLLSITLPSVATAVLLVSQEDQSATILTGLIFANALICLALTSREKKQQKVVSGEIKIVEKIVTLPPLPVEMTQPSTSNFIAVNEQTQEIIRSVGHLFDNKISIENSSNHISLEGPISKDFFSHNFTYFLKGTSSLFYSKKNDYAFVNFSIREEGERISLNATINNVILDEKDIIRDLSFNEEESACSLFNQIEENLFGHKPIINIRAGQKNTTIELSMTKKSSQTLVYN
jgi:hypothetical protein